MGGASDVRSPTVSTSQLLLIRHGQSTWNDEGRWQGQQDPPLTALGVRQARIAAQVLGSFDLIASSTLQRAFTTAGVIADAHGVGPVVADDDLVERSAGPWEGLTRAEIHERYPGWLDEGRRPEGYETDESVLSRSAAALGRIAGQVGPGGTALVVTHGGVIHNLERFVGATRDGRLANLGGRWFEVGPGRLTAGDTVVLVEGDELTIPGQI